MNRLLQICSSVVLICTLCTKGYADEHFPFLAEVSKKSVNIRAGANTNFERIGQLNQGDEIIVLAKSYDWYKVQAPSDTKAFIRADYLRILQNSTAELIGDKVNIRALADSNASSLGILPQGTLVKTITQTNGWWQIEPPPQAAGWIRQDFLALKSTTIPTTLVKKTVPLKEPEPLKASVNEPASVEVKGRLLALTIPVGDIRYQLRVNDKPLYYVTSAVDIERFKGAIVLVKGVPVSQENDKRYEYPLLRISNISLLL